MAYYSNYGNTARALEPAPDRQKPLEPAKTKKRSAVMFVYRNDHKHKLSVLTVITLLLIFTGAAGIAVSYANISIAEQRLNTLTENLREKQLLIKNMTEQVNRHADTSWIMEAARNMGMSEPKPYQIVHINVPDENHVKYKKPTE